MDWNFCLWAPWVFSALAGIAGWLLRWWYDDKREQEYLAQIKTKDEDIYHLNEAHNLLLKDKEQKLETIQEDLAIKDRSIEELKLQISQAEESNKSLLSKMVQSKKSKSVPKAQTPAPVGLKSAEPDKNVSLIKDDAVYQDEKRKKSRRKKHRRLIASLKKENRKLKDQLKDQGKLERVVQEIPIKIFRTIRIREQVDQKALKKMLKNLPMVKKRKVLKEKRKKGKPRIISE